MNTLFLIAHIAGRAVAIDSAQVESVVDIGTVIPVPRTGGQVLGLAALRSRVVTVIDTRAALNVPAAAVPATRAVITAVEGHHYAVLVDSLEDVSLFERLPLSPGLALDRGWARAGVGIVERDSEPLLVLDLAAVVPGMIAAAA